MVITQVTETSEPRNIYLLSPTGTLIWQIAPVYAPDFENGRRLDTYCDFDVVDGQLIVFPQAGGDSLVNWEDGSISWLRWSK